MLGPGSGSRVWGLGLGLTLSARKMLARVASDLKIWIFEWGLVGSSTWLISPPVKEAVAVQEGEWITRITRMNGSSSSFRKKNVERGGGWRCGGGGQGIYIWRDFAPPRRDIFHCKYALSVSQRSLKVNREALRQGEGVTKHKAPIMNGNYSPPSTTTSSLQVPLQL